MAAPRLVLHAVQPDFLGHALLVVAALVLGPVVVRLAPRSQVIDVEFCLPSRVVCPAALPALSFGRRWVVAVVAGAVAAAMSPVSVVVYGLLVGVLVSCALRIAIPRHARGLQGLYGLACPTGSLTSHRLCFAQAALQAGTHTQGGLDEWRRAWA